MADFSANPFVAGKCLPIKGSKTGALAGLRFVVKDNLDVAGTPTGLGLPNYGAPAQQNAPLVAACLSQGADLLGKVVMDELAFSLLGLNRAYGAPANPAAPGCVAGGSSCGSASAVAQKIADFALGSDTAGSVRVPASFCGLWGMRPTHGALSSQGMAALAHSFDTPGWLCVDASTMGRVSAALLPECTAGAIKAAIICGWLFEDNRRTKDAILWAEQRGLEVTLASNPPLPIDEMLAVFGTIQSHEAYNALHAFLGHQDVGDETQERIRAGAGVTAQALAQARQTRSELIGVFDAMLADAVLLAPTAPSPPLLSELQTTQARQAARTQILAHTILASLAGAPQVSAPMWPSRRGPIGLGVVAARGADRALVDLCTLHDWSLPKPY